MDWIQENQDTQSNQEIFPQPIITAINLCAISNTDFRWIVSQAGMWLTSIFWMCKMMCQVHICINNAWSSIQDSMKDSMNKRKRGAIMIN